MVDAAALVPGSGIYCVEVESFQDSDGDGIGDFRGLISRLDYLSRLGVTCLWLSPIHPSPWRDDGYDVCDYYGVDPRFGTLGDFTELVRQTSRCGTASWLTAPSFQITPPQPGVWHAQLSMA